MLLRRIAAATAASLALSAGTLAFTAPPASAAVPGDAGYSPGYVTKQEFRNVKRGMTSSRVHAIFDTKGKSSSQGWGYMSREYKTPSKWGFVFISYKRQSGQWVLTGKSAYWG